MAWNPSLAKLPYLAGQAKYIDISLLPFWGNLPSPARSMFPLK